jgi:hypothetical protein
MLGTALGLVKRSEKRESSDTVTGNETTDHSLFPGSHGGGFNSETDHEDDQTEDKKENYDFSRQLTTIQDSSTDRKEACLPEEVGDLDTESSRDGGHRESTEKGSERHERGNEGLTSRGNGESSSGSGIRFTESTSVYNRTSVQFPSLSSTFLPSCEQ